MSESMEVALVAGMFNVATVIVSRLLSRKEHRRTSADVLEIKEIVRNGKATHE